MYFDPDDIVHAQGRDGAASAPDLVVSREDLAEHEIVGHVADNLAGRRNSEPRAVAAENRRRARRGESVRRTGTLGWVESR